MAKIVYEVVADTKTAERELQKFNKTAETTLENGPKYDLVEDDTIQKFDKQIEYIEAKISDLKEKLRQIDLGAESGDVFKIESQIEGYNNQLLKLKDKQVEIKNKTQETGNEIDKNRGKQQQLNSETNKHGFQLKDIVKKVKRIGLAIFGVSTAYGLVRRAISMVAGSNDAVAQKIQQMRNVIANSLTPLVETIVNFLMKAMVYINYVTKALFGKAIFDFTKATGDASKNMKSTQKSASGTAKALKQASKQLAGFDEMNVLSDNRSSGGGGTSGVGGVGGLDTKNMFEGLDDIKIPDWLVKVTGWIKSAIDWFKKLDPVLQGLLGTIALVLGVGFKLGGGSGLLGLASILGKLATIGVIAIGVDLIYSHLTGQDLYNDLKTIYDFLKNNTKETKDNSDMNNKNAKATINLSKKKKDLAKQQGKNSEAVQEYTNYLLDQIKQEKQMADQEGTSITDKARHMVVIKALCKDYEELYEQGLLNNEQQEIFKKLMLETAFNGDDLAYTIDNLQYYNGKMQNSQKEVNKQVEKLAEDFGLSKKGASDLKDALYEYNTSTEDSETKTKKLYDEIEKIGKKSGLSKEEIEKLKKKIGEIPSNKEINVKVNKPSDTELNKIGSKIGNAINRGFNSVVDLALNVTGKTKGNRKGALIKYAKGGIINQPSRGVPLAIGGEAGREGVIPLTDSQQMALLGEAIGKYITINANITNTMNGRVLSRELQKIQNEEAFGSNRW